MKPSAAVSRLVMLKAEAVTPERMYGNAEVSESWKNRVRAVVARSLGERHQLVEKLDKNHYHLTVLSTSTPQSEYVKAFVGGVRRACGYIDAAIYELELLEGDDEPVDERGFDPELWDHVHGLIDAEDWGKVAANVSIFVEDKVRTWAGTPEDKKGEALGGKALYAQALADDAELRLGKRAGEWEGWRFLGMGFTQAVRNVDLHRIQDRPDARRYALGVLGLGSLLLTQLRYEHGDLIEDAEGR